MKKNVIIVTDGDSVAQRAVEVAAQNIKARTISASAGSPTPLTGEEIVNLVKSAPSDPIVIMFDDRGSPNKGKGEKALEELVNHPDINVLGVLAVASNTPTWGVLCNLSITNQGQIVNMAVDKNGHPCGNSNRLKGDTVDVLNNLEVPIVLGIGDIGKMEGKDDYKLGAEITTKALKYILSNWRQNSE